MQTKVSKHLRKGKVVLQHQRKVKGVRGVPKVPGVKAPGGEMRAKKPKVAAAPAPGGGGRLTKGSPEAVAHMAKLRSMRKT